MNFKQKLTTGLATGTALATMFSTAAFAADVDVSGNALSHNNVVVADVNVVAVEQNNTQVVSNVVKTTSNTGGNVSSFNLGGGSVNTGNSVTNVTNTTTGGNNTAVIAGCGCDDEEDTVTVSGNLFSSTNVGVVYLKLAKYKLNNTQVVSNKVKTKSNTGKNAVMFTLGGGGITTGASRTTVTNTVTGGSNGLVVTP
jgi:hypothetical protein